MINTIIIYCLIGIGMACVAAISFIIWLSEEEQKKERRKRYYDDR